MSVSLGTASVSIVPNFDQFATAVQEGTKKAADQVTAAGEEAGKAYGDAFTKNASAVAPGVDSDPAAAEAEGSSAGKAYGKGFEGAATAAAPLPAADTEAAGAEGGAAGKAYGDGFKGAAAAVAPLPESDTAAAETEGEASGASYSEGFKTAAAGLSLSLPTANTEEAASEGQGAGEAYSGGFREGATGAVAPLPVPAEEEAAAEGDKEGGLFGEGFGEGFKTVLEGVGIFAAFEFIKDAISDTTQYTSTLNVLNNTLATSHDQIGLTSDQIQELAKSTGELDGQTAGTELSIAQVTATFGNIKGAIYQETLPAINDLAAGMHVSLPAAAKALDKALSDPAKGMSALTRYGITFSAQNAKTIQSMFAAGQVANAQGAILANVQGRFRGAAEAAATPVQKLKAAWYNFAEDVGSSLQPMFERLVAVLSQDVLPVLEKVASFVGTYSKYFLGAAAAIAAYLAVVKLVGLAQKAWNAATAIGEAVMKAYAIAVRVVQFATEGWAAAQAALSAAWDASPVGVIAIIVIAIAAAIALVVIKFHLWHDIVGALGDAWKAVSGVFMVGLHAVEAAFDVAARAVKNAFGDALAFVARIAHGIAAPFIAAFMAIKNGIVSGFDGWWKSHGEQIKQIWQAVWAFALSIYHTIIQPIFDLIKLGVKLVVDYFKLEWQLVVIAFQITWLILRGLYNSIIKPLWDLFIADMRILYAGIMVVWTMISALFKASFDLVVALARVGWDLIIAVFTIAFGIIEGGFKLFWDILIAVVNAFWGMIQTIVKIAWDTVVAIFDVFLDLITGKWQQAWTDIQVWAQQVWNAIAGFFTTYLVDPIKNIASDFVNYILNDFWHPIQNFFTSTLPGAFTSAVSAIGAAWSSVQNVVKAPVSFIVNTVYDKGIAMIWNDTAGEIGLPKLPIESFDRGGWVGGPSAPNESGDRSVVRINKGERVLSTSEVAGFGGRGAVDAAFGKPTGGYSGGVGHADGGIWGDITSAASDVAHAATSVVGGAIQDIRTLTGDAAGAVVQAAYNSTVAPMLNSVPAAGAFAAGLKSMPGKWISDMVAKIKGQQDANNAKMAASVNLPGNVTDWIAQGMAAAGVSGTDWATGLAIIAKFESGGNQAAVNNTDSNAKAGTPSAGLMQFIQPTFNAYAKPGYTTWMNPVDQVVADAWSGGYIPRRYGSIDNVPGVKSVRAGGAYVGYDNGGPLPEGVTMAYNGSGGAEGVLTPAGVAAVGGMQGVHALNGGGSLGSTFIKVMFGNQAITDMIQYEIEQDNLATAKAVEGGYIQI